MGGGAQDAFSAYARLTAPVVILDAEERIVYLNASAEAFWRRSLPAVEGRGARDALPLLAPQGQEPWDWGQRVVRPALTTGEPFVVETILSEGQRQQIRLSGTRFRQGGQWYFLVTVLADQGAPAPRAEWGLRDPLTGLFNRRQWEREFPRRDAAPGLVLCFDVDGLKRINEIAGHRRGDEALEVAAAALGRNAPPGALVVRPGGDEFLMVVPGDDAAGAAALGEDVAAEAAEAADARGFEHPLQLSWGVAPFAPGGLRDALARAEADMYERRGVLLRGALGGRIVLTRGGRPSSLLRPYADGGAEEPGAFAAGFGPEFDAQFRQAFARAAQQAVEFVDFVAPERGAAVVEVGAGSGRLAFDGGLADRVGPDGQLLLTDPSPAQMAAARRRAAAARAWWVRFLIAPVEDLPLASGGADLALGALFLHLADPGAALRAMARLVRPGGRVALNAGLPANWGPAWEAGFEPVRRALARRGLPFRDIFLPRDELEALFAAAGLAIEDLAVNPEERNAVTTADAAVAFARSVSLVPLLARGLPAQEVAGLEAAFEQRMREAFAALGPAAGANVVGSVFIKARKPA